MGELHPMSPKRDKILRFYNAASFDADLDAAGRVTLPPKLLAHGD